MVGGSGWARERWYPFSNLSRCETTVTLSGAVTLTKLLIESERLAVFVVRVDTVAIPFPFLSDIVSYIVASTARISRGS